MFAHLLAAFPQQIKFSPLYKALQTLLQSNPRWQLRAILGELSGTAWGQCNPLISRQNPLIRPLCLPCGI